MTESRYLVKGKELADLLTDKHLEDLYYGKSGDLVALTLKDPDTIELHGRRDDLDDMVKTLARDYEKGVVTRYEMKDGKTENVMSVGLNGIESTKDWQGKDMPGLSKYRLSGRDLGDLFKTERWFENVRNPQPGFDVASLSDGVDAVYPVTKHPVNVAFESSNTLIVKAYPVDIDRVVNYMAKTAEISVSKEDLSGADNAKRSVPAYDDSLDSVYEEINRKRALPLNGEFDGDSSNGPDAEYGE